LSSYANKLDDSIEESEIYRNNDFDKCSSYDLKSLNEDISNYRKLADASESVTRLSHFDISPQLEHRRNQAYNDWLESVKAREKRQKKLQKVKSEVDHEKALEEEEERKRLRDEKLQQWYKKKEREAQLKIARMNELKRQAMMKKQQEDECMIQQKELTKAKNFKDWMARKNNELKAAKEKEAQRKQFEENEKKRREAQCAASYQRWKNTTAKTTPKPVAFGRGLESLRGTTSKLYQNPVPWN
jgi:hypothetical protein